MRRVGHDGGNDANEQHDDDAELERQQVGANGRDCAHEYHDSSYLFANMLLDRSVYSAV